MCECFESLPPFAFDLSLTIQNLSGCECLDGVSLTTDVTARDTVGMEAQTSCLVMGTVVSGVPGWSVVCDGHTLDAVFCELDVIPSGNSNPYGTGQILFRFWATDAGNTYEIEVDWLSVTLKSFNCDPLEIVFEADLLTTAHPLSTNLCPGGRLRFIVTE